MKLFCSYAYTGEKVEDVERRMKLVVEALKEAGHEPYCPLFDELMAPFVAANDLKSVFSHAFKGIKENEAVVVINSSDRRSEGQLMEIGASIMIGKPVYLMQNKVAVGHSYLPKVVTATAVWETEDELRQALQSL
jgi:hypothetical protein